MPTNTETPWPRSAALVYKKGETSFSPPFFRPTIELSPVLVRLDPYCDTYFPDNIESRVSYLFILQPASTSFYQNIQDVIWFYDIMAQLVWIYEDPAVQHPPSHKPRKRPARGELQQFALTFYRCLSMRNREAKGNDQNAPRRHTPRNIRFLSALGHKAKPGAAVEVVPPCACLPKMAECHFPVATSSGPADSLRIREFY